MSVGAASQGVIKEEARGCILVYFLIAWAGKKNESLSRNFRGKGWVFAGNGGRTRAQKDIYGASAP